jgi:large subunit ribosomal protein L6
MTLKKNLSDKLPLSLALPSATTLRWGKDFIFLQGPSGTLVKRKGPLELAVKNNRVYLLGPLTAEGKTLFSRLQNLLLGVSEGYYRLVRLFGVGFRVWQETPDVLSFKVGHTHPVAYTLPADVSATISPSKGSILLLKGCEKARVNQIAREIRSLREPNAYTGKGIRLRNEKIVLKPGKREKK